MRASCLCGQITWEVEGPLEMVHHCHCGRCRKAHGSAFATYGGVGLAAFRLQGQEHLRCWESSPGFGRYFCGTCGSVVPGVPMDGRMFTPLGNLLEDTFAERPIAHIFVGSKAPWYEITDSIPQFEAYPPGFESTGLPDRAPLDAASDAALRGSCLCGGVSFLAKGELLRAYHCYCSRCRRARSAAHASNLFTRGEDLEFTRGADLLKRYQPPDAKFFAQTFCGRCGSPMPRPGAGTGVIAIPMGCLDDSPGLRPQAHIFVSSKAAWVDIQDGLPQFETYPG